MTEFAIVNFLLAFVACVITIATGLLLARHRKVLLYFKGVFSFIRDDYYDGAQEEYPNLISEMLNVITYGFSILSGSTGRDETIGVERLLVLLGRLTILTGIIGMVAAFINLLRVFIIF